MKKIVLALVASLSLGTQAFAGTISQPLWDCALTFHSVGGGIQFLVGEFRMSGKGTVRCVDIAGNVENLKVQVTLGGPLLAANVAVGIFAMQGIATGIGVATGPQALLGTYYTLGSQAADLIGTGTNISLHGGAEAVNMNLGAQLVEGLGFQVGINRVRIRARD